jgi:thiaminase/transcriptional activator TenA
VEHTLFAELKSRAGDLWQSAQQHTFVEQLGDGSLARDKFTYFLEQDYIFLISYSRALALATAKAPSTARMNAFAALTSATLSVEMELHREYCGEYGVSREQLEAVQAAPTCRAYCDFCVSSAAIGDSLDLLAALSPCCVGYGEIAQRLAGRDLAGHPYLNWIETYSSAEYLEYSQWLVSAINEMGEGLPAWRVDELTRLFVLGCRYEWMFWEMAWTKESWRP